MINNINMISLNLFIIINVNLNTPKFLYKNV